MKKLIKATMLLSVCATLLLTGCNSMPQPKKDIEKITENNVSQTETTVNNEITEANDIDENDIKLGDWGTYNVRDFKSKTMAVFKTKMRINKITRETEDSEYVNKKIDEYNSKDRVWVIDKSKKRDDTEYVIAEIDFEIPNTEKISDYNGVPLPMSLAVKSDESWKTENGDKIIFTTTVVKDEKNNETFKPGDTGQTNIFFSIPKNTKTNYYLEAEYPTEIADEYETINFQTK